MGEFDGGPYGDASKLVDGVGGICEVVGEEGVGGGSEVGGCWVGEEVVEGVDNVGGLEGEHAAEDWGRVECRRVVGAGVELVGFWELTPRHRVGEGAGREGEGDEGRSELHGC